MIGCFTSDPDNAIFLLPIILPVKGLNQELLEDIVSLMRVYYIPRGDKESTKLLITIWYLLVLVVL